MPRKYAHREITVPQEQWTKICGGDPRPLDLYFSVIKDVTRRQTNTIVGWRQNGAGPSMLAKALAFFFTMDDYGRYVWEKVTTDVMLFDKAIARIDRARLGEEYAEWNKEQQELLAQLFQDFADDEKAFK